MTRDTRTPARPDRADGDLFALFEAHRNPSVDPRYYDRADRNRFAAEQLRLAGATRVLNLGGGGARHLQASLAKQDASVYEIDVQGDCDLKVNLDTITSLPFEDRSFDVVCAFDVLEHLEKFHLLNEEMFRVARDFVLISLPNSAAEISEAVLFDRREKDAAFERGVYSQFYGIPLGAPTDRHRWWMYFLDIVRYYGHFAASHQAALEFWTPKLTAKKKLFKAVFGTHIYHTFFCPFVWIKLGKRT